MRFTSSNNEDTLPPVPFPEHPSFTPLRIANSMCRFLSLSLNKMNWIFPRVHHETSQYGCKFN
ncbi:hypothetical protein ACTXT7_000908 [Hymenolepis weldensis]